MNKGTLIINGIDYTNGGGGGGGASTADAVSYDNSTSGLTATNVQEAIDEQEINLRNKQDSTDIRLETNNKTVVGGINELNESLNNKEMSFKHYDSEADALADIDNIEEGQMVETNDYEASSGDWDELWSGSSTSGSVTLSQPISNYKTLAFRLDAGDSGATFLSPIKAFILDSSLTFGTLFLLFPNYYSNIKYINDTTIQITRIAGVSLRNVYGMK